MAKSDGTRRQPGARAADRVARRLVALLLDEHGAQRRQPAAEALGRARAQRVAREAGGDDRELQRRAGGVVVVAVHRDPLPRRDRDRASCLPKRSPEFFDGE